MLKKVVADEVTERLVIGGAKTFDKVLYFYLSPDKKCLILSSSAKELLNHILSLGYPLTLSLKGISFFLQSGVIPTPSTIYEEVYVLSIGDYAAITSREGKLEIEFYHEFPYPNSKRIPGKKTELDKILSLLAKSILRKIDPLRRILLFQSVGKDSNTILLALIEAGLKDKVTALTLALPGSKKDESKLASEIAKKVGVRHKKLFLPKSINSRDWDLFIRYFENIPFPCADGASLAYPLYQLTFDLSESNILDGSGVDYYFGHVPRPIEYKRQKLYPKFKFLRPIGEALSTGNLFHKLARARCEMAGFIGITLSDLKRFFPEAIPVYPYWFSEDEKRKGWDYFDLKADVWATHAELGNVIRKVSNFTEVFNANLVLPFADEDLADYVGSLDEAEVFDRKNFKNKLPLRKLLYERLGLDSDKIRKYSYGFPTFEVLESLLENRVKEEILNCKLWDRKEMEKFYKILVERAKNDKLWQRIFERLFLLSAFLNHSKFLNLKKS